MAPIFFAHANGFPSATYRKLFEGLRDAYRVLHLDMHAHDPRFPVDENWENLVEELLHHVSRLKTPVWGVGHSLGGLLHYHAALKRPGLYRGVVMLDSPVLGRLDRWVIQAAKRFGFIDRITPAGRTKYRRSRFPDPETALHYFAGKALFEGFDPDCLQDYVRHGLAQDENEGAFRLRFNPQTEISIYRTIPHRPPPGQLSVPLAMVRGETSKVIRAHHVRRIGKLAQAEYHALPGGHMFPLERPQDTAVLLKKLFARWQQNTGDIA